MSCSTNHCRQANVMATIPKAYLRFDGLGHANIEARGVSCQEVAKFHLNDSKLTKNLGRALPPHLADLLEVAMATYLTDRVVGRRPLGLDEYDLGWKRKLTLEIPVRRVDRWQSPEVQGALCSYLEFLTEDDWEFIFVRRQGELLTGERQYPLFPTSLRHPVQVALFSGGLDSLAGAVSALGDSGRGSLILLSGCTNPRLGAIIETLAGDLQRLVRRDLRWLGLPLGLQQRKDQYNSNERSQRTRGFLYGALGAITASLVEGREVVFYENGIGAINLPYSPRQFGTHSTRSMNPVALALLTEFLTLLLEHPISLQLPNLFATKGEVCESLQDPVLRPLINGSVTCDSYPLRHKQASQCGICTSCLLRRQSLWAAGLHEADSKDEYFCDILRNPSDLQEKRWYPLCDMMGQVDTFRRALSAPRPWAAVVGEYPMLKKVAWTLEDQGTPSDGAKGDLLGLLQRYSAEWEKFPRSPPGWESREFDLSRDWRFRHAFRSVDHPESPRPRRAIA